MFRWQVAPKRPLTALLTVLGLVHATPAVAGLSDGCTSLGEAMVEHSCFHSTFGPFISVPGTPGTLVTVDTANVDPVHTEYRVGLPERGQTHVITYKPQRSGSWVVFTSADIPLQVLEEGAPVAVSFEQRGDTGCEALPLARVYSLTTDRHTFQLGPTDAESVVVVVEYADDFLVSVGPDNDGDGFGRADGMFISNCTPPEGYAPNASDCDDADPNIHPSAVELCDDVDQNCNGSPDDVGLQCRAGSGICVSVGELACVDGVSACQAEVIEPTNESCNGQDDDCDGIIDNGTDTLCGDDDTPRCVRQDFGAFCGCLLDGDCGSLTSGRVCDVEAKKCADGCSTLAGGNGCPDDMTCEVEGGSSLGVCVPKPEERPKGEKQSNLRGVDDRTPEQGCQCTLGKQTNAAQLWGVGLMSLVLLPLIHRRTVASQRKGHSQ